jgi:hypothetical protein
MQKSRSWQDSFDRLALARREESALREDELRQVRDAEAAYAKASAAGAGLAATKGFMLADEQPDKPEVLDKPKRPAKPAARKASPRKPRRAARLAKPKVPGAKAAKPKTAKPKAPKSIVMEPGIAPTPSEPSATAPPPVMAEAQVASSPRPEALLITPLPRHASLAPYRKPGLFGLIGSWLRLAARRPALPTNLRRHSASEKPPRDDVAALKAENEKLRRQLKDLLAQQDAERASQPPWLTAPAGDVPARPRRRGGPRA